MPANSHTNFRIVRNSLPYPIYSILKIILRLLKFNRTSLSRQVSLWLEFRCQISNGGIWDNSSLQIRNCLYSFTFLIDFNIYDIIFIVESELESWWEYRLLIFWSMAFTSVFLFLFFYYFVELIIFLFFVCFFIFNF